MKNECLLISLKNGCSKLLIDKLLTLYQTHKMPEKTERLYNTKIEMVVVFVFAGNSKAINVLITQTPIKNIQAKPRLNHFGFSLTGMFFCCSQIPNEKKNNPKPPIKKIPNNENHRIQVIESQIAGTF